MAAKTFVFKEFKAAVKSLNKVLKDGGSKPIKVVGVKKEIIIEEFTKVMLDFIDKDKTTELPDEAIEFFNVSIVGDDDDPPEEKKKDSKSEKKKDSKSEKKKDSEKKDKPKKKKAANTFKERLKFMGDLIEKNKFTLKEVTKKTHDKFPESTLSTVETNLRDARNKANTKFPKVVVMDKETKILSFAKK